MSKIPHVAGADSDLAFGAAQCVVTVQRRVAEFLRVGQKLPEIDRFVASALADLGCESCFYKYPFPDRVKRGPVFPSHACLSVNECIVHGTAGYYPDAMKPGDVLKIDVGVVHKGWIGDAAWTYVFKDYPSPEVKRLMQSGRESLARGVKELRPGNTYLAWARAVQKCVEKEYGFHLVRGLGGHGYGRRLHETPFISNVVAAFPGEWPDGLLACEPGTLVAVEPMIAVGTGEVEQRKREWPVFTKDGSIAVHYEHDVLITAGGPRVLTEGMEGLPDVVG